MSVRPYRHLTLPELVAKAAECRRVVTTEWQMVDTRRATIRTLRCLNAEIARRGRTSVATNVDVVYDEIDDPKIVETLLNWDYPRVRFTLTDPSGPGGGAPVFRIDGSRIAVLETLRSLGYDDVEEMIEPETRAALAGRADRRPLKFRVDAPVDDGPADNWGGW